MTRRLLPVLAGAASLLLIVLACSDNSGPDPVRPPADLRVIRLPFSHPPLYSDTVSFVAVKGQSAEGKIYFVDDQGQPGDEYLRLQINSGSLKALPDGTPLNDGDSVRITLRVVSSDSILFQFEPSGLAFDIDHPAELTIRYSQCEGDFNDDGHVDHKDDEILGQLAIWRQPLLTDPYTRLASVRVEENEEIEADLTGFSRYAIAY
ncbi:MAG TPA: hypothetical protein VJN95_04090 [Gemmatimonadales bacterium]|nr:hypothetical protein [Gemmatimonadales bacterium]